jgi:hypothetical protein
VAQPSGSYDATGFHAKRMEFDPEYDNDAETIVADMEFSEFDNPADVQLKLQMLMLYNRCVGSRGRRRMGSAGMDGSPAARWSAHISNPGVLVARLGEAPW